MATVYYHPSLPSYMQYHILTDVVEKELILAGIDEILSILTDPHNDQDNETKTIIERARYLRKRLMSPVIREKEIRPW